jgi:hypothetical protein
MKDIIKYFLGAEIIQSLIGWPNSTYLPSPSSEASGRGSIGITSAVGDLQEARSLPNM